MYKTPGERRLMGFRRGQPYNKRQTYISWVGHFSKMWNGFYILYKDLHNYVFIYFVYLHCVQDLKILI